MFSTIAPSGLARLATPHSSYVSGLLAAPNASPHPPTARKHQQRELNPLDFDFHLPAFLP
jgi:hypothetical protein